MTISLEVREQVRQRANYACEFCGVAEIDTGGQLTIDHFQPKTKGGSDELDNLIYCCQRCNQYKLDYWPLQPDELLLWNPRQEKALQHFLELDDGSLLPLTPIATFTIRRLRLNRSPLIAYRLRKRQRLEELRLLNRYQSLIELLEQLNIQMSILMEEQQALLLEQQELLQLLLRRRN
ncbi:MAG: HNH endonuclease [Nitrososphaera sp.]|nr:HNH endonuclease [Nitrososphaera sp.]